MVVARIKKIMNNMLCVTGVYLRQTIKKFFVCLVGIIVCVCLFVFWEGCT